jgi:uncharacterized membrane protein
MNAESQVVSEPAPASAHSPDRRWRLAFALIALSAIPVAAGLVRLARLAIGEALTADNARFVASPLPVVSHVLSASLFCMLGALQFVPTLRQSGRPWHRTAGRLLVPLGVAAALSGLWMTLFYELPVGSDLNVLLFQRVVGLLQLARLLVGTGMLVSLALGVAAIRARSFARHRAWMTRAYALGMGAGTQALLNLPWLLIVGKPEGGTRVLLMVSGWLVNLALAEWFIVWGAVR